MNKLFFLVASLFVFCVFDASAGRVKPVCDILYRNTEGDDDKVRESSTLRASPSRIERVLGQEGQVIRIPGYPTFLLCSSFHSRPELVEINYEILKMRDKADEGATIIGQIQLQFYPNVHEMRLRYIEVDEKHQRQGHATRGLESVFADLKIREEFKVPRKVFLEVSDRDAGAIDLYLKFGFSFERGVVADVIRMSVQSDEIRFPLFQKSKAAEKSSAAASSQGV